MVWLATSAKGKLMGKIVIEKRLPWHDDVIDE